MFKDIPIMLEGIYTHWCKNNFTGQVGKHLGSLSQSPPAKHNQFQIFNFKIKKIRLNTQDQFM